MSIFINNFIKSWFYFFKIMIGISLGVFSKILSFFFNIFNFGFQIFIFFIKFFIGILVLIYFGLKKILTKKKSSNFPLKKQNLEFLKKLEARVKKEFILFLDLDKTLIKTTEKKPKDKNYTKINLQNIDGPKKKLYLIKRNYLIEFLQEVK